MTDENDFRWIKNRIYKTNIIVRTVIFLILISLIIFLSNYYKNRYSPPPEPIFSLIIMIFLIILILFLLWNVSHTILSAPTYMKITDEDFHLKYALKKKSKVIFWNQILKILEVSFRQVILHPEIAKETHTMMGMRGIPAINTIIFLKDGKKIKLLLDKKLRKVLMQTVDETGYKTSTQPPTTHEDRKDITSLKKPRKIPVTKHEKGTDENI
ncbi:MAG: hypothetical protein QMC80_01965 [Thermoplasmatales archaeon]|nr:hypothetical protein [Thermoplasmatales archaeon]